VTDTPAAPPDSGKKRLKYALIASLALNLLILGAVAGTMYTFHKHGRPPPGAREDFGLMGLSRDFPSDRRKAFRKELKADREKLRPLVEEANVARREAADALAAEPFDRAKLEAAIVKVMDRERAVRQSAVTVFLGHAETLTPDERKKLADWWRKKAELRAKRPRDDDKPDGSPKD
jgi:uncharacterized membrane protein